MIACLQEGVCPEVQRGGWGQGGPKERPAFPCGPPGHPHFLPVLSAWAPLHPKEAQGRSHTRDRLPYKWEAGAKKANKTGFIYNVPMFVIFVIPTLFPQSNETRKRIKKKKNACLSMHELYGLTVLGLLLPTRAACEFLSQTVCFPS